MNDELDFNKIEASIGKMVLACSRVEYELIRLYEKYLPERAYHRDSYFYRYNKAINIAKSSLTNGNMIATKLIKMKEFAEYRHLIAHNPVHYTNDTGTWHILDLKQNNKSVAINNLAALSEAANKLSIELSVLLRVNV